MNLNGVSNSDKRELETLEQRIAAIERFLQLNPPPSDVTASPLPTSAPDDYTKEDYESGLQADAEKRHVAEVARF